MAMMITVENLAKEFQYYEKELGLLNSLKNVFHREKLVKRAVNGITFSVEEGEMVGVMGPNGAGKTTTMKMLSGILYPTGGTAQVNGFVPWERKKEFKKSMAIVMGQKTQLNWDLPANESFYLMKCIYELDNGVYEKNLEELLEVLDAKPLLKIQVRRLSLGERMKMELIASLLHRPKVVFLDEPTIGLDFISQKKIREFIRYYNQEYRATVLLTSHYLQDLESLCRRTLIINHGDIVYDGDLGQVSGVLGQKKVMKLQFSNPVEPRDLARFGRVLEVDGVYAKMEVDKNRVKEQAKEMLEHLTVVDLNVEEPPMEDAIARLYQEGWEEPV